MKTIIITVESEKSSKEIINLLKKRKDVMSILTESDKHGYNWIHPNRPATSEEITDLISDAEKTPLIAAEDAAPYIRRSLNQWKKKRKSR